MGATVWLEARSVAFAGTVRFPSKKHFVSQLSPYISRDENTPCNALLDRVRNAAGGLQFMALGAASNRHDSCQEFLDE